MLLDTVFLVTFTFLVDCIPSCDEKLVILVLYTFCYVYSIVCTMCPPPQLCLLLFNPAMSIINKSFCWSLHQLSLSFGVLTSRSIFVVRLSSVEVFPDLHLAKVQGGAQQGQLDVTWKSVGVHWGLNLRIHMIYVWFGTWL